MKLKPEDTRVQIVLKDRRAKLYYYLPESPHTKNEYLVDICNLPIEGTSIKREREGIRGDVRTYFASVLNIKLSEIETEKLPIFTYYLQNYILNKINKQ